MDLRTVGAWRKDADQVVSDLARRLMAWMTETQSGGSQQSEEVAVAIERGLRQLLEADAVVVLARAEAADRLLVLAATDMPQDETGDGENGQLEFVVGALLRIVPHHPFLVREADQNLQELVQDLGAQVRRSLGFLPVGGTSDNATPALVTPLCSRNVSGRDEVTALALAWMTSSDGMAPAMLEPALGAVCAQAGGQLASSLRTERLGRSYRQLAEVFGNVIDGKEPHRSGHSAAVAYYAGLIAREMGLSESEVEGVEFAGLLHGIGKIAVPDAILQKGAALSQHELQSIRLAAVVGGRWLSEVEGLREVAEIVRHQNETFDGKGYPDGLIGDAIPLGSRILAVASRFSAMTRPRPDRKAMSVVGGALESVAEASQGELDPRAVDAFLAVMGRRLGRAR